MSSKTYQACGAGIQSTTLSLLAAEGVLPKPDAALFADTGWEPREVYDHLDKLEQEVLIPAGIPLLRVSQGNLRDDVLTTGRVQIPLYVQNPDDGSKGINGRGCTRDYKVAPIKRAIRELLGYPPPAGIPADVQATQWIGISTDEAHRAKDSEVRYLRNVFPLLDMGWSRSDCERYLRSRGWGDTPKSACIGCPFHGNRAWRNLRDNHPDEWRDAVAFDAAIRQAPHRLRGTPFLHASLMPLDVAPIDRVSRREWNDAQTDIFDAISDAGEEEMPGCSPFSCRDDLPGHGDEKEGAA